MKQTTKMSRAVSQLEHMFNSINTDFFNGELPQVIITVQSKPGTYGHSSRAKVWKRKEDDLYEINIAAEVLSLPIEETIDTICHESIHLYCRVNGIQETSNNGSAIDAELEELRREMEVVAGLTRKCIKENSTAAQDQGGYTARYNGYVDRYEKAKERYDTLTALRQEKLTKAKAIDRFMATVSKRDELLTEFDNRLWLSLVDYAEVHRDGTLIFHFCDGIQITE